MRGDVRHFKSGSMEISGDLASFVAAAGTGSGAVDYYVNVAEPGIGRQSIGIF
jgi:hypothetical protein